VTLHISSTFDGRPAGYQCLSTIFALQQLYCSRLQGHLRAQVSGIAARYVHLVASDQPLSTEQCAQLDALLQYGEPYAGATDGELLVVTPRFGTVSPWASKATDIAHNCGLALRRVERIPSTASRCSRACWAR